MQKREIKFRAWDKETSKMYRVLSISFDFNSVTMWSGVEGEDEIARDFKDVVLMQFTGLHDKNGKEIYEKYRVTNGKETLVVGWNQLHNAWCFFDEGGGMKEDIISDWINDDGSCPKNWEIKNWEIIGNIYDNPELL